MHWEVFKLPATVQLQYRVELPIKFPYCEGNFTGNSTQYYSSTVAGNLKIFPGSCMQGQSVIWILQISINKIKF